MKTKKNMFYKLIAAFLAVVMPLALTACQDLDTTFVVKDTYKIGIIQYAEHPSLDNCYEGIIAGLKLCGYEEGTDFTVDFQNAQGEMANSDLIAKNMVAGKCDMIIAIATPAAMSSYSATKDTNIPVVFSAVSDPVAAGIVESLEAPGYNVTGTSDILPLKAQMKMIRGLMPDAKKIGIIYTTSEPNSVAHLTAFKELASEYNFEIVDVGVTNASEVGSAAATLVAKGVDCINNFTDNNVVNNLSTLLNAANQAGIPVFGSEVEQVRNGCMASESLDYFTLGKETAKIAAKILNGEAQAKDIPVSKISDSTAVYSKKVMDSFGIKLSGGYASATNIDE